MNHKNLKELHVNSLSASHDNWCTATLLNMIITAQWEGMGDVGSARYILMCTFSPGIQWQTGALFKSSAAFLS